MANLDRFLYFALVLLYATVALATNLFVPGPEDILAASLISRTTNNDTVFDKRKLEARASISSLRDKVSLSLVSL